MALRVIAFDKIALAARSFDNVETPLARSGEIACDLPGARQHMRRLNRHFVDQVVGAFQVDTF